MTRPALLVLQVRTGDQRAEPPREGDVVEVRTEQGVETTFAREFERAGDPREQSGLTRGDLGAGKGWRAREDPRKAGPDLRDAAADR